MLQLSELRPHTRNIHHVSEAGWSSKTRWPVGWSPGKIIYDLWEPLSIKIMLKPSSITLESNQSKSCFVWHEEGEGNRKGRTKVNAWEVPGKTEVGRTTIKLAIRRSRFHSHACHSLCSLTTNDSGICSGILKVLKELQRSKECQPQLS